MIENLPPRIRANIIVDDCWIWTGYCVAKGYGRAKWAGRKQFVHRIVYELLIGAVPNSRELHHVCKNKRCCNPAHLQTVTDSEHLLLEHWRHGEKTCKHGHPYDEANTSHSRRGHRVCKTCNREKTRRWREKELAT